MDRKNFLRIAGTGTSSIDLAPPTAITIEDDSYRNSKVGLAISKPPGWQFATPDDWLQCPDALESGMTNAEPYHAFNGHDEDLILSISNTGYSSCPDITNPSVFVWARPTPGLTANDFFRSWEKGACHVSPSYLNRKLLSALTRTRLAGVECMTHEVAIDLELVEATIKARVREYCLLVNDHEITIAVQETLSRNSPNCSEFDYILGSLVFNQST